MPTEKDAATEGFREGLTDSSAIVETDRADSGLTTLSFQSMSHTERHVWMDTDLSGEAVLDLEDWSDETQWDNSVAHGCSQELALLSNVAKVWLTGGSLDQCKEIGGTKVQWR